MRRRRPQQEREFDELYTPGAAEDCWLWMGGIRLGYGTFWAPELGETTGAHRYAYWRKTGVWSGRTEHVDHICHNPRCVNPAHLRLVTPKQNSENRGVLNSNNKSGHRGVSWHKGKRRWVVYVRHDRAQYWGGQYVDLDDAVEAAVSLRAKLFTHCDD